MPRSSNDKTGTRSQKKSLKRNNESSDNNDSSDDNIIMEMEEEEWETETDSSYVPPRKSNSKSKSNRRIIDDSSDDEEDEEFDSDDFRELLGKLYPSKHTKSRIKSGKQNKKSRVIELSSSEEEEDVKPKRKTRRKNKVIESSSDESSSEEEIVKSRHKSKPKRKNRRRVESSSDDSSSEEEVKPRRNKSRRAKKSVESSEDEFYENDSEITSESEEDEEITAGDFNLIFSALTGGGGNEEDEGDKKAIEDDNNEEYDSDDEKTFMKETYETVALPEELVNKIQKKMDKKNKNKKNKKHNRSNKSNESETTDVGSEYKELVELKRHLSEKLEKKPKNKILINAVEECRESIRKLVQSGRLKNAKKYYKMIKGEDEEKTSEIDYFKKQLSNKEQLRVIKELTEINDHIMVKKPYRLTLLDSNIPAKFKSTVMQKINMLKMMEPSDSEYFKLKTWVDGFMRIPFSTHKSLDVNITDGIDKCSDFMERAKKTLDECVYGLDDAKMQIMQMIGQWITNPDALGSAIAIQGPPGTGKTSLVKEGISKILGREFAFIALGGTGDSSFLEGHGYTYEGSMWGRIVQILMECKCMNPVIYFDELDKVSDTPRGEEIIGILTHLTDTSQNTQYHDKYFSEIEFDLSKCLFIFSYNDESKINPILRDRMYQIQTKGYEKKEKLVIARDFLLPKIREQVAFKEGDIIIPDETISAIISNQILSNGEEGVRNMKRCLEIIHTKLNLFRLMKPDNNIFADKLKLDVTFPITVTEEHVKKLIECDEKQNQSVLAMYV